MKIGIVCEGGGMRGVFTAGVLQAFMESGFMADELVGVSAGASNGVTSSRSANTAATTSSVSAGCGEQVT